MYNKQISALNNRISYFPSLSESSYANSRLAALQQQLHVSTSSNSFEQHSVTAWSNLVVPYHPQSYADKPQPTHNEESNTRTEEKPTAKKKNPYSIEELLKKPEKKERKNSQAILRSDIQQPFGALIEYHADVNVTQKDVDVEIDL